MVFLLSSHSVWTKSAPIFFSFRRKIDLRIIFSGKISVCLFLLGWFYLHSQEFEMFDIFSFT